MTSYSNAKMNRYMKARWKRRRRAAVKRLGGKCVDCGTRRNLQFDHPDPTKKEFTIAKACSYSEARFWPEVLKCVLRCVKCHKRKSGMESSVRFTKAATIKCACRRLFLSLAAYVGHRRWCRLGP